MTLQEHVSSIILQPESETLEYKAVLPPSKSIAQIMCAFANTDGGTLVLGVNEIGGLKVSGLSEDFRATSMTHKALDLLIPKPIADYGYVQYQGKKLFAVRVEKSSETISVEGKIFVKRSDKILQTNQSTAIFQPGGYIRVSNLNSEFDQRKSHSTDSQLKLLEHYQSIFKMIDTLKFLLYPEGPHLNSSVREGEVLSRILFSSIVDNFETYLSDILFEIYLAKPETLKSEQMVKVEDVLNCVDIQEFVTFWAKQKIGKLQKGSVKGFVSENKQIKDLNVIDAGTEDRIEKILQIRHLYSHRNGVIDDKFLKYFPVGFAYGEAHTMSIDEILDNLEFLTDIVGKIDSAAVKKHSLSTV